VPMREPTEADLLAVETTFGMPLRKVTWKQWLETQDATIQDLRDRYKLFAREAAERPLMPEAADDETAR